MKMALTALVGLVFCLTAQAKTLHVGCGDVVYLPNCVGGTEPSCHWMQGVGQEGFFPMTLSQSEFGDTWTAKWSGKIGNTQVMLEVSEFDPTGGEAQYSSILDVTTDGKSHAYASDYRQPGVARLFAAVVNPDNTGGGAYCAIFDIK